MHLGQDVVVLIKNIIGIFDIENTSINKNTRDFLSRAQRDNKVVNVSAELPKSFVLCAEDGESLVYISPISTATLKRRMNSMNRLFLQ